MKNLIFLFGFSLMLLLSSCTKNNSTNPVTGDLTGNVTLLDPTGNSLSDFSNAFVNLKNTNFKTTSDVAGKWTLSDVPAGTYDIIFSKPGFDSLILFGYQFVGNGTIYLNPQDCPSSTFFQDVFGDMYNVTSWSISQLNPSVLSNPQINYSSIDSELVLTIQEDTYFQFVSIFASLQPNTSKYSYKGYFVNRYFNPNYDYASKTLTLDIGGDYLSSFKSGDKVYLRVYPGFASYTQDLRNSFIHWMGIGQPAQEISFIMPY